MRFSEYFGIQRAQAELDFVDIPLDTDIKVFIDPYAVTMTNTPWCRDARVLACDFFQEVLGFLRGGNRTGASLLLSHLREDNRTRLGYSQNGPQGTGFGTNHADPFLDALEASEAFKTGKIEDIEDMALFVERVGVDIVSDMMTNLLREMLIDYTQAQCELFQIPMTVTENYEAWRSGAGWTQLTAQLPTNDERAIILVPRAIVRKNLSLNPGQYLTDYLDNYCDRGNLVAVRSLEKMLQGPVPKKHRGKVKRNELKIKVKKVGSSKNFMWGISNDFPESLTGYKNRAREKWPVLTPSELELIHPQGKDAEISKLIAEMRNAARNVDDVMQLSLNVTSSMIAALHPIFQHPRLLGTKVNGFAGVVMSNTSAKGPLWAVRRNNGQNELPNIVVLTTILPISDATLEHIDVSALRASTTSGLVVVVGTSIDSGTRNRRGSLASTGVVVMSTSELADITEVEGGAEMAADAFTALMAV